MADDELRAIVRRMVERGDSEEDIAKVVRNYKTTTTSPQPAAPAQPQQPQPQALTPKSDSWSTRLGLNEPTSSPLVGFGRGSGAAAVDMLQGATSEVGGLLQRRLAHDQQQRQRMGQGGTEEQMLERERMAELEEPPKPAPWVETPPTTAGTIGTWLPTVAATAATGPSAARRVVGLVPRTARAGQKFNEVMAAAKNIPVDVEAPGAVAMRIQELAQRGGSMPKVAKNFIERITDPQKAAMTFEELRDYASNLSRLSQKEVGRLTPVMTREVRNMRDAVNASAAKAAEQAGKLPEYTAAMKEYAQANQLRKLGEKAWQSVPYLGGGGAIYALLRKFGVGQ